MADREGEQLTEEAMLLNRYLNQYRHCISVKKNLERRMMDIQFEFNHPLSAVKMSGMPHAGSVNTGCAALSYRLDEIETRINAQMEKGAKILADILDVIDFCLRIPWSASSSNTSTLTGIRGTKSVCLRASPRLRLSGIGEKACTSSWSLRKSRASWKSIGKKWKVVNLVHSSTIFLV